MQRCAEDVLAKGFSKLRSLHYQFFIALFSFRAILGLTETQLEGMLCFDYCPLPLIVHLQAGFTLRQLSAQGLPALHLPLELSLQPDVLLPHLSLLFDVLGTLLCVWRQEKKGKGLIRL